MVGSVSIALAGAFIGASIIGFFYAGYTYVANTRHPLSDRMGAAIIFHRIWRRSAVGILAAASVMHQPWGVLFGAFLGGVLIGYLITPILDRCAARREEG